MVPCRETLAYAGGMSSGQEAPSGQKVSWQAGDSQHAAEPRKQPIAHRGRSVTNSKSLELGCCASSQGKGRQRTASLANASDGSPGVTPRRPGLRKGSIESNASTPRARSTCAPARKSQHPLGAGGPGQAFARRALRARGKGRGLVRTGSFSELRDRVGQRACQARVCRARVSSSLATHLHRVRVRARAMARVRVRHQQCRHPITTEYQVN